MLRLIRPSYCSLINKSCILQRGTTSIYDIDHRSKRNYSSSIFDSLMRSPPVLYAQDILVQFHDVTHMPWWTTIIVSTIISRALVTLPLAIYQHKIMARVENVGLEMPAIAEELKKETSFAVRKFGWDENQAKFMFKRSLKKQYDKLIIRDNCHPAKSIILVLFQIPLWITNSYAIRNLVSGMPDPSSIEAQTVTAELALGGFGFIPNLIDVDHSFIIPVAFGLVNLTIIEIQKYSRTMINTGKISIYMTNFFRVFTVFLMYIASSVPSALCLYWFTSSLFGFGQNILLLSPRFRRLVRIPKTKSELEKPYSTIVTRVMEKFKSNK